LGGAGVEHLGDIRMVHHGERLPLLAETGDDLLGVHPEFDDLQGNPPLHGVRLFRHPDDTETALADLLQKLVRPDLVLRLPPA
jgi:hypothetical protein